MERGRPRPQQRTCDRRFSRISSGMAIGTLLRPRTGALRQNHASLNPVVVSDLLRAVNTEIKTQPALNCPLCRAPGKSLYEQMTDRSYAAPGVWNLRECETCRAVWLHPQPTPADIGLAYQGYYTHHRSEERRVGKEGRS